MLVPIYTTVCRWFNCSCPTVTRTGTPYPAVVTTIGSGYSASDQLVFAGTQLGGATTANDMTLTVDSERWQWWNFNFSCSRHLS